MYGVHIVPVIKNFQESKVLQKKFFSFIMLGHDIK